MFRNNPEKRKKAIMWSLYALLLVGLVLLQTVFLGRISIWGIHLDLLPVLTACVAVCCGAEQGGTFALCAGLLWALSGGSDGGMTTVCLTVSAIGAGYLCDAVLHRNLLTATVMCAMCCLVTFFGIYLVRIYLDGTGLWGAAKCLLQTAVSLVTAPGIYWLARKIRKAGP